MTDNDNSSRWGWKHQLLRIMSLSLVIYIDRVSCFNLFVTRPSKIFSNNIGDASCFRIGRKDSRSFVTPTSRSNLCSSVANCNKQRRRHGDYDDSSYTVVLFNTVGSNNHYSDGDDDKSDEDGSKSSDESKNDGYTNSGTDWDAGSFMDYIKYSQGKNEAGSNEDDDPSDPNVSRRRKRDVLADWMKSGNKRGNTPPVQPIRMEDGSVMEKPARKRARFDKLFAGMPTLDDILSGEVEGVDVKDTVSPKDQKGADNNETDVAGATKTTNKNQPDYSWFTEEEQEIQKEYLKMMEDMKEQVRQQRLKDPEGVPDNAEGVVESIILQEMKTTIKEMRDVRAQERIKEYADALKNDYESQDGNGKMDNKVRELIEKSEEEYNRRIAFQAEVDEFQKYQQEKIRQQNEAGSSSTFQEVPSDVDLDKWALERLQEMLTIARESEDDDGTVSDILEENIDELKRGLEKELKSNRSKPTDLKEWQMWRAIATKLGEQNTNTDENDPAVTSKLDAWKDFVEKENKYRKDFEMVQRPKMPFEWHRDRIETNQTVVSTDDEAIDKREVRRQINQDSVSALEDLLQKTDNNRRDKLKTALEALKSELDALNYYDPEQEVEEDVPAEPVDLSEIFKSSKDSFGDDVSTSSRRSISSQQGISEIDDTPKPPKTPFFSQYEERERSTDQVKRPNTPFFADDDDESEPSNVKAPNTPFFSDYGEGTKQESTNTTDSKLGSLEEQKLRSMYRRAGATTIQAQEKIRKEWEAYQEIEKKRREESGLSDKKNLELPNPDKIKVNTTGLVKDDGDVDAEKILAAIGPRPARPKASSKSKEKVYESDLEEGEALDAVYRSVSAVGGDRRTKDNPKAKQKEKSEFQEFLEKQEEMRRRLDDNPNISPDGVDAAGSSLDDEGYAENVLASIGPRPVVKKKKRTAEDGVKKSSINEKDSTVRTTKETASLRKSSRGGSRRAASRQDDMIPEWLQKEREEARLKEGSGQQNGGFLGTDIDDVFDDDEYEKNLRQLAEYERRRAGKKQRMGINIDDALGRASDDYADYTFEDNFLRGKDDTWGMNSFEGRKSNMLAYKELSVPDVNAILEFKNSIYSTGSSPYTPRINKPFKEFGAIFRLESVLVDITGFHLEAWKVVANKHGFEIPPIETVRQASVLRPEKAVRECFYWTTDFSESMNIAAAFRQAFKDIFDKWVREKKIPYPTDTPAQSQTNRNDRGSMAIGEDMITLSKEIRQERQAAIEYETKLLMFQAEAWSATASKFGLRQPSIAEVEQASILNPETMIRDAFGWTSDPIEIEKVASSYEQKFNDLKRQLDKKTTSVSKPANNVSSSSSSEQEKFMELQYDAWSQVAMENNLAIPSPELVSAAAVMNDPEAAIMTGFGWTSDPIVAKELSDAFFHVFHNKLRKHYSIKTSSADDRIGSNNSNVGTARVDESSKPNIGDEKMLEEILDMQMKAWEVASKVHGFKPPSLDEVKAFVDRDVNESVRRLLSFTFNEAQTKSVLQTFNQSLRESSGDLIKKYNLRIESPEEVPATTPGVSKKGPTDDEIFQSISGAWAAVASRRNFPFPDGDMVQLSMMVGPEASIMSSFNWTDNREEASVIAKEVSEELQKRMSKWNSIPNYSIGTKQQSDDIPLFTLIDGADMWIKSLLDVEMPCGLISYLEKDQVQILLDQIGLSEYFPPELCVTGNNGYATDDQQMLGAALRIERRPDHCVVFDAAPMASDFAHSVEMKSVALIGPYPRYELLSADSTSASFYELSAMNIRRLFGERVDNQPMLEMEQVDPQRVKKVKTKYFWDDD